MPILHELRQMLGEEFAPLFYVLSAAQCIVTVWMVVDAGHRRIEYWWFWVIIGFQPFGAWIYFLLYKLPEAGRGGKGWSLFQRRVPLDELRYRAEHLPTLINRLALAERLIAEQHYEEALPYLESARKSEPDHARVLYCVAYCHSRLNRPEVAEPLLEGLLARDPRWSKYIGWHLLIVVRKKRGNAAGTLASCRELVRLSPTLGHQCVLAEVLVDQAQIDEARSLLERALRDHEYTPGPIRRRNGRAAAEARRLLKAIDERIQN